MILEMFISFWSFFCCFFYRYIIFQYSIFHSCVLHKFILSLQKVHINVSFCMKNVCILYEKCEKVFTFS